EKIAFEKAGIIKSNVPIVTGATGSAFKVIEKVARTRRSTVWRVPNPAKNEKLPFRLALTGPHQRHNAMIAAQTLKLLPAGFGINGARIARAFANVRWPGRFERFFV